MANLLGDGARFIHIAFGALALAAFWIPIFARKGGRLHIQAGKVFVRSAYVVLTTAALALTARVTALLLAGRGPDDDPGLFAFIVFLAYLTFVTYATVRQGMGVLRHKRDPAALRTPFNQVLAYCMIAASALLIAYALIQSPPNKLLLFALSPIGALGGIGNLRYMNGAPPSARAWFYEHLGAMLGAGIAFHTAFAVFGATRLFDIGLTGWVAVIPWVAPTVIGVPAIIIWTAYFRRKFGDPA